MFYHPSGAASQWQQFQIAGSMQNPFASHLPADARGDIGSVPRGNLIWNGPASHLLGIEGGDGGACPAN